MNKPELHTIDVPSCGRCLDRGYVPPANQVCDCAAGRRLEEGAPAVKVAEHAKESGHWYDRAGNLIEQIDGKAPDMRNKLVQRHDLAPGITSIMRMRANPGIILYQRKEAAKAAARLVRDENEPEEYWLERVLEEAETAAREARDAGTKIHAEIHEGDDTPHVDSVRELLHNIAPDVEFASEIGVACSYGFGTKSDRHSRQWVFDIKGTEKAKERLEIYPDHRMQLAATKRALLEAGRVDPDARCGIIFTHRKEAWAHCIEIQKQWLGRGWAMFLGCLALWQGERNYVPTWGIDLRERLVRP